MRENHIVEYTIVYKGKTLCIYFYTDELNLYVDPIDTALHLSALDGPYVYYVRGDWRLIDAKFMS
jgi:hypothetical protein